VELPFRIKFLLNRKLSGYELPAISKWQKISININLKIRKNNTLKKKIMKQNSINSARPLDRVNGYNLNQIQNSLNNCRDIDCWENKLRDNYSNPTENNLKELFDYVRAVRNNMSSPCN
jgi:hypothetical protein